MPDQCDPAPVCQCCRELAMWQQIAKQERAAADALRAQIAKLIEERPRTTPPPFMALGELDDDGVTIHRYEDGPQPA